MQYCFMVTLAFILGLPMLNSTVAFNAVISISVIGLYISCGYSQYRICNALVTVVSLATT